MTCILVDDQASARAIIRRLCDSEADLEVIGEFENAIEALRCLNKETVDVAFLDIHMPGFTGFDFMETIRHPLKVVLITSDDQFALESYGYAPVVDYLVKPISPERFAKAVEKIRQQLGPFRKSDVSIPEPRSEQDLFVNIDRRLVKISLNHILFIEAKGDYILVKTDQKDIRVHTTLKSILEKLPEDQFLKIHRSFIINIHSIVDIEDNSVLIGKNVIPISRVNRPELLKRINLL